MGRQVRRELPKRLLRWQMAKPEQVGGLLERGVPGQVVDIDTAIGELALGADDVADGRVGRDYIFKARLGQGHVESLLREAGRAAGFQASRPAIVGRRRRPPRRPAGPRPGPTDRRWVEPG